MKRDSVLINILTRLSYTDYTQQFNKYFWYILKYVSQSNDCRPTKKKDRISFLPKQADCSSSIQFFGTDTVHK